MMSFGLCSTSEVIAFDQNWCHLYSSSTEGKDLSDDTPIRVIHSVKPQICMKVLRNFSEKCGAKFNGKNCRLDDAFQKFLNWK